jgi:hypothetical protein
MQRNTWLTVVLLVPTLAGGAVLYHLGAGLRVALFGALFVSAGLFVMLGAAADWDWFMHSDQARPLVDRMGHTGARVFYMFLGLGLTALAVWLVWYDIHGG